MISKKTEEIYSTKSEIEFFHSPNKESIVTKILKKEFRFVLCSIDKFYKENKKNSYKALDIGCSGGRYSFALAKSGINTIGVDISQNAINFANKKKKELGLRNIDFKKGDITNLKFNSSSMDIIICIEVLHHLTNTELKTALDEIKRVLKPNGIAFLDLKNRLNPAINLLYTYHTHKTFKNTNHVMLTRTPNKFETELKRRNFKILKNKGILFPIKTFAPVIIYKIRK